MKKNKMMRLASVLLIVVLLTTSVVGGTFAKYVTTGSAESDSARVAKWGVTVTAATDKTTFSKTYATNDETVSATITNSVNNNTDDTKLVAPGTSGTLAEVAISGTPEVAVAVTYDAEVALNGWTVDSEVYCPLVFKVNETEIKIDGTNTTTALLETAIEDAIEGKKANYPPNTDLSTATTDDVVVTWAWAFEGNDDAKDTALGNLPTAPTVSISVTTTVTQID